MNVQLVHSILIYLLQEIWIFPPSQQGFFLILLQFQRLLRTPMLSRTGMALWQTKTYWTPDLQRLKVMYQPDTTMGTVLVLQLKGFWPTQPHLKGISDHAMFSISANFRKPSPLGSGSIPTELFQHGMFRVYHEQLRHDVKLGAISDPWTRLEQHKAIISASALFASEFIQDCKEETPFAKVMALSTLARAVWTQNSKLALNVV